MNIPEIAAQGYTVGSEDYERTRPSYPPQAVELLVRELRMGPTSTVLDLGAGTGKLTRLLAPTRAALVAVEPVDAMRRRLAAALPDARVLAGTAEEIPLADASVDAVVAGTAFHWFRGEQAVAEITRVLRPHGGLGLVWNNPDVGVDWVAQIWGLVGTKRRSAPRNSDLSWQDALTSAQTLTPLEHQRFSHSQQLTIEGLVARVRSIAFIASLPQPECEAVLAEVRDIACRHHPELAPDDHLQLPYRTDVYWCRKA